MKDSNLELRDGSANLTATANGSSVDFGGADKGPITYEMDVPSAGGTSPTVTAKIQESDNGSTWQDFITFPQVTAAGRYYVTGLSDKRYRRAVFTVGGTSPNFGKVTLHPVFGGRHQSF